MFQKNGKIMRVNAIARKQDNRGIRLFPKDILSLQDMSFRRLSAGIHAGRIHDAESGISVLAGKRYPYLLNHRFQFAGSRQIIDQLSFFPGKFSFCDIPKPFSAFPVQRMRLSVRSGQSDFCLHVTAIPVNEGRNCSRGQYIHRQKRTFQHRIQKCALSAAEISDYRQFHIRISDSLLNERDLLQVTVSFFFIQFQYKLFQLLQHLFR